MTPDGAGEQDANLVVQAGLPLVAGDLIGILLMAIGSDPIHWGFVSIHQQVCPNTYLTAPVSDTLSSLIQRDTPGGLMGY